MAHMDGAAKIERLDQHGDVRGIGVHVMTVCSLAGTPMAATVVCYHAIAVLEEEEHLIVPIVTTQRPAVMEDDGLCVLWAPILVEDFGAVFGGDRGHWN